jgi:SSS family solute:Na+ symporter
MYLITLIIYFIILSFFGLALSKKNIDFDSYFFGKRKLGTFLIFFTVTASWFGGASTIATIDDAYKKGFESIWLIGIPTILTIFIFVLINKKIREIHFVSLPIFLNKYYGKLVSSFASFLIFFYMTVLAASQFVAWGKFVSIFIEENYEVTVITGAVIVILYSYLGGYISVVLTDGLQFFLLTLSIIYLILSLKNNIHYIQPSDLNIFSNIQYNMLMAISFTLAWLISPIIWQRISSANTKKSSKRGLIISIIAFSILYILIILIAICLRKFPVNSNFFSNIIKNSLPLSGSILVFIGIGAAIMSTADSAINIGALTLVKDVFNLKDKKNVILYSKISTFISGSLAVLIALEFNSIIKTLGLASEIMAEGLFIPGMYALFFKKRKPFAALLSIILGGGFSIIVFINAYGLKLPIPEWPYSLPYGLSLSLIGFLIGYFIDKKNKKQSIV